MANAVLQKALKTDLKPSPSTDLMPGLEKQQKEARQAEMEASAAVSGLEEQKIKAETEAKATQAQQRLKATEGAEGRRKTRDEPFLTQEKELGESMMNAHFEPSKENLADQAALFSLINVIGFAIGAGGKQNAQAAMSAMNGMLEGHQQGRADVFKEERAVFDKNIKALQQRAAFVEKELAKSLQEYTRDKDAGLQRADVTFAQAQADFMKTYAQKNGLVKAYEMAKEVRKNLDKAVEKEQARQIRNEDIARRDFEHRQLILATRQPKSETSGTTPASANVTSDIESSAQAIANYAQKPPGLRDKTRPQIMARVRQINPEYNEMDYGQRDLAMRNYTNPNGTGAKQLQAFTTVAGHLESLERLGEALNNKDTQLANRVLNYIAVQTGQPNVTNFNAAKQAVAGEVVKAITGTAGALADRKEAEQIFNEIQSPEQLQGAIDTVKELIYSRLDTTRKHYESATGRHDFETRLPDIVKQTFIDKKRPTSSPSPQPARKTQAPPEAVQYLKQHPEFKEQFKAKYGYLPEGM